MKIFITNLIFLFVFTYALNAQVVTPSGFESNDEQEFFNIPNTKMITDYNDSLSGIYLNELLTACVYSTLHELIPNVQIEYSINNRDKEVINTDSQGRFFISGALKVQQIHIRIESNEFYLYDTIFQLRKEEKPILLIELQPKYKIILRGRVFAGNMPLEGANVIIDHKGEQYNLSTLSCYTDDENYWNCLYLGMFKQSIAFEDPHDSLTITIGKEGFQERLVSMTMADYDGTVLSLRLKYAHDLIKYPKHNIGIKFGHTFQNTWSVGVNYVYQPQLGKFNRLGIGIDGAMLMSNITTQHASFNNMAPAEAETYYPMGMIGPLINFSITKPTNRLLNIYAGVVIPYLFPKERIAIHPYVSGKIYLDLNKAIFWEVKYIDYTINETEYLFNPYGNAEEIDKPNQDYQKLLFSLGILVSF